MKDDEIDKLAKAISKIVIESLINEYYGDAKVEPVDENELVALEVQRLNDLLSRYVGNEEYEKALIIKRKIEIIQKRYKL